MIIKCKMCGGDLRPAANATTCECEYCGSVQTIPKLDNKRRLNLYDRANHFRRNNEFDKAMGIFEQILQDDRTDAEAYWSLVLCRYGIEYVEDPATKKRIPTVNRAQFTSIFADDDYKSALEYADAVQKGIYEEEAKAIDDIQKGILDISKKEKPFDVFICYKETDTQGRRTPDSVLANDLYHQLTREGFKVFFSRITLEDKLGQQYEPYIFAALNSAKVMVVLGTKPEYFNAVWVKNEWSRYLKLIKSGANKTLVPAYKDMDPYDLPDEFSHLQAQDLSKLGFMQDLIHGIKKIAGEEKKTEQSKMEQGVQTTTPVSSNSVAPLLRRVFLFLEDRDWNSANEYCEKVLDIEPENARAYMGKMMAELRVEKEEELKDQAEPFNGMQNYKKAIRFGDTHLKKKLEDDIRYIKDRNEHQRQAGIFAYGKETLKRACTCADCRSAADIFKSIPQFDGVKEMLAKCKETEESIRKDLYDRAVNAMQAAGESSSKWDEAKKKLAESELNSYRDVAELRTKAAKQYDACLAAEKEAQRQKEEKARREAEAAAAKKKRNTILGVLAAVIAVAAFFVLTKVIIPNNNYNNAVALMNAGKYEEAITAFTALNGYSDSAAKITACNKAISERDYQAAIALMNSGKYEEAITAFTAMNGYSDSATQIKACKYKSAVALMNAGKYEEAITAFTALDDYSDSAAQIKECKYLQAGALNYVGKYNEAYAIYATITGYKDVDNLVKTDQNLVAVAARVTFTNVGNIVTYGHYEQDNNTNNGQEAIEWVVLKYDGATRRSLLISCYGLDAHYYHNTTHYPTWEKSDIRAWLNSTFLNAAFTNEEQKGIVTTKVSTPSYKGNSGGSDTQDKLWLLSSDEATTYFTSDEARKCTPTAYAVNNGAYQNSNNEHIGTGYCWWWLRSPGNSSSGAYSVSNDGSLSGSYVYVTYGSVRPAFWLDLDSAAID